MDNPYLSILNTTPSYAPPINTSYAGGYNVTAPPIIQPIPPSTENRNLRNILIMLILTVIIITTIIWFYALRETTTDSYVSVWKQDPYKPPWMPRR